MPDIIKISELDEALALADAAEFPYYQDNGGQNTTYKAPITQIGAKIVEGLTYQGINLPAGAGNKTVENSLNYLIDSVGGDPNGNISDSYDTTAAYVKGDLCIYENVLYICTAPTTGAFDPSNWTATTIDNVIGSLSTLTTTDKSSIVGAVNEVDGAITSPKDITSDYITMASGYTFTSGKVYKQGKHIFGNIVLSGTLQGGNNTDTLGTIKSDYRTADPINGFCGISNGQWFTNNIGYVYIASSGGLQVATTPTGMNYAKIHLDYVTA